MVSRPNDGFSLNYLFLIYIIIGTNKMVYFIL
jgi:hypothetical protein